MQDEGSGTVEPIYLLFVYLRHQIEKRNNSQPQIAANLGRPYAAAQIDRGQGLPPPPTPYPTRIPLFFCMVGVETEPYHPSGANRW
jgi:hypothetical protein